MCEIDFDILMEAKVFVRLVFEHVIKYSVVYDFRFGVIFQFVYINMEYLGFSYSELYIDI